MLDARVRMSTLVLVTIALFDLVTTLMLMNYGLLEANPLFRPIAVHGALPFALAKAGFVVGPVMLLEYVRSRSYRLAEFGTWTAALLYASLYVGHVVRLGA